MKCFYHSADLDGHCSGAIVKSRYPECEMIGINYGDEFPFDTIKPDEIVYMVDFGLQPFGDMEKLNDMCELHWIDHHKTAIDTAHEQGFMAKGGQFLEVGLAGCELAWEYLYPEITTPMAVTLLGRYDVWDHSDVMTLPFQYGMRNAGDTLPESKIWEGMLSHYSAEVCDEVYKDGSLILKYEAQQSEKFCSAFAYNVTWNGLNAICANRGFSNSKLFDSVYDDKCHHLMIMYIWSNKIKQWKVSLYSTRADVDCGLLAKEFGGGGHKGAAGFQCTELPFNK